MRTYIKLFSFCIGLLAPYFLSHAFTYPEQQRIATRKPVELEKNKPVTVPKQIDLGGDFGPVRRLADGRLLSIYSKGRSSEKWEDTSIPQRVFGRWSKADGEQWSDPQLLFTLPEFTGVLDPFGAFVAARDGVIHYFCLLKNHLTPRPINWRNAYTNLVYAVSRDNGKTWEKPRLIEWGRRWSGTLNSAIETRSGRILLPFCYLTDDRATGLFAITAIFSDDAGQNWKLSKSRIEVDSGGKVLESGAIEPAIVELANGKIWMVIRTQTGYLFEASSSDGGETWSEPRRTSFHASNCPVNVLGLTSGPIVLIWNNEFGEHFFHGVSYSRQSLVMAINDGRGWHGYREVAPPFAEGEDVRAVSNYPFLAETSSGDVLVSYRGRRKEGDPSRFRLTRVAPGWLFERGAIEDFSNGTRSIHFVNTKGVAIDTGPEGKPALRLRKTSQDSSSGFTWNFPFASKGKFKIRLQLEPGFKGVYFALSEYLLKPYNAEGGAFRWMIGPDLKWRIQYNNNAPYLEEPGAHEQLTLGEIRSTVETGRVLEIEIRFDSETNVANVWVDGHFVAPVIGLEAVQGLAYFRIFSAAPGTDPNGLWVTRLQSEADLQPKEKETEPGTLGSR